MSSINIRNPELIERLARFKNLFITKPVITSSGQFIPVDYSRGIFLDPVILQMMCKEFARLIDFAKIDVIAGIDLQGVPLAVGLMMETGKPMVIVREKPKRLGRSPIIGDINFIFPGARVLLVDDAMAYGGTKEERTKLLEEQGAKVTDVAVFVQVAHNVPPKHSLNPQFNYQAQEWLTARNIRVHKLIDYHEIAILQEHAGTISKELSEMHQEITNGPYWEDTQNLTRLYEYMKRENLPIEEFVVEFMKEHGVEVS